MTDIDKLRFDEAGLIPAIVVDDATGDVLMLAYMNKESLQISIAEGRTCFWSRSRRELWRKGESSGNVQRIVSIKADCDMDALLISVDKAGPACHTGAESCFFHSLHSSETSSREGGFSIGKLYEKILDRKTTAKPGSYTNYLFDKGVDKILKKFGEEATEVVIAGKGGDRGETVYELADLTYHALVLMAQMDIDPREVADELASRFKDGGEE